jgi:hypothetical protein
MIQYERHRTDDKDLTLVQDRVEEVVVNLQSSSILGGHLIEDVEFVAGVAQPVYHGLGRKYQGYLVVSVNAKAIIEVVDASNIKPMKYISLQSYGTACTASLWVF